MTTKESKKLQTATLNKLLKYLQVINNAGSQNQDLTRSNFKRVDLKGEGKKYYFSFRDHMLQIEICLEPCFNGFDVGLYDYDSFLVGKKECTDLKDGVYKDEEINNTGMEKEIYQGTLERSEKAWDKALKLANRIYRERRNLDRIRRWKLKDDDSGEIGRPDPPPSFMPYPTSPGYIPPSPPDHEPYWKDNTLRGLEGGDKKL